MRELPLAGNKDLEDVFELVKPSNYMMKEFTFDFQK